MLHSVGCAQPSAKVFADKWNNESYDRACVHAFIDANTGDIYQTLPWNFRAWHCGGTGNDTHIGVELCESSWIRYTTGAKFEIVNRAKALADCTRSYHAAVELFAMLCSKYKLNPLTDICSHKEGGKKGIASGHVDPEHYWAGLGAPYTMDGFRNDVHLMIEQKEAQQSMTDVDKEYVKDLIATAKKDILKDIPNIVRENLGKNIVHVDDIKNDAIRATIRRMVDEGWINGGTSAEEDPDDVRFPENFVRVIAVMTKYVDSKFQELENKILFRSEE